MAGNADLLRWFWDARCLLRSSAWTPVSFAATPRGTGVPQGLEGWLPTRRHHQDGGDLLVRGELGLAGPRLHLNAELPPDADDGADRGRSGLGADAAQ
jgi:hypothetical protein